jgi:hypothetical protein
MRGLSGRAAVIVAVVLVILAVVLTLLIGCGRGPRVVGGEGRAKLQSGAPSPVDWGGARACIPAAAAKDALREVRAATRGFGPATPAERAALDALAARLSEKHGVALRGDQLAAIRDMEVSTAARHSGLRAQRHGAAIAKAHAAGDSVLEISARLGIAPLAVLRQVLVEGGASETQVREMVADPARLPPRLAAEAAAAFEADIGSRLNADRTKARSQAYEDAVGEHLRRLGVEFRTENDLREAHARAVARGEAPPPLLTPDFVFPRPVRIRAPGGDAREIWWLDAKNYTLYGSKLVTGSLARQAEKYAKRFGPGAMVFSGGLACGVGVLPKGAGGTPPLLLDGAHIGRQPERGH